MTSKGAAQPTTRSTPPAEQPLPAPVAAMLEAHVQFELRRWRDDGATSTGTDDVDHLVGWLTGLTLAEVVDADRFAAFLGDALSRVDTPDPGLFTEAGEALLEHALADDTELTEVFTRADFDGVVDLAMGLTDLRAAIIDQVTSSDVYAELLSHVLYQGLKEYLVEQNPIARNIPGASSLLRLGQGAINSAAPGLERGVDRQLSAFVAANIQDTIRDSRDYLEGAANPEVIQAVADEVWRSAAGARVRDVAAVIPRRSGTSSVGTGRDLWRRVRDHPSVRQAVRAATVQFHAAHGQRAIGDLLADAGMPPDAVRSTAREALRPLMVAAAADGTLERHIRARLEPFYREYAGSQ